MPEITLQLTDGGCVELYPSPDHLNLIVDDGMEGVSEVRLTAEEKSELSNLLFRTEVGS